MPRNQFGQKPVTTSAVISADVWTVDTHSVQLTYTEHRCHCSACLQQVRTQRALFIDLILQAQYVIISILIDMKMTSVVIQMSPGEPGARKKIIS